MYRKNVHSCLIVTLFFVFIIAFGYVIDSDAGGLMSNGWYWPTDSGNWNGTSNNSLKFRATNDDFPGAYHVGKDIGANVSDNVYSMGFGYILYMRAGGTKDGLASFFGGATCKTADGKEVVSSIGGQVMVVRYLTGNGHSIDVLYGHIDIDDNLLNLYIFYMEKQGRPVAVSAGQVIGKVAPYVFCGSAMDHLHLSVKVDDENISDSEAINLRGYYTIYDDIATVLGYRNPETYFSDNAPLDGEYDLASFGNMDMSGVVPDDKFIGGGGYDENLNQIDSNDSSTNLPLPNLHIEEFNVHDTPDHKLPDDGTGYLNLSQNYEIHVWPESLVEHCGNGTSNWEQEVRTDTFMKISLSEEDGEWELIHRSYTHCKYMNEDDSKKETFYWTVPADAAGKMVAFKSKVDTQNIIQETDETDNWSDTEYYPVEGYCPSCPNLTVPYAGLTAGKTSVDLGGKFGLEVDVMNQGNVNCPIDVRGAYYLKAPNATSWTQVADDGSEAGDLDVGESEREYTMDSPFTANQVGTWQAMFCADHLNAVREQDENDNCRIFSFNVNPVGPDFIISSLGFKEGLSFKRKIKSHPWANVRNIGNKTPSSDIRIAYYIDGQYRDDDGVSAGELTPGRDQYESVNNDNIKLGDWGTRTLTVCVDVNGQVPELNENNNCASVKFTVIR